MDFNCPAASVERERRCSAGIPWQEAAEAGWTCCHASVCQCFHNDMTTTVAHSLRATNGNAKRSCDQTVGRWAWMWVELAGMFACCHFVTPAACVHNNDDGDAGDDGCCRLLRLFSLTPPSPHPPPRCALKTLLRHTLKSASTLSVMFLMACT